MSVKSNKEEIVKSILDELSKGNIMRNNVLAVICGNIQMSERTFDKYWKIALERHKEAIQAQQKAVDEQMVETAKEVAKRDTMSRVDILEELAKIAKGKARKFGEQVIFPSDGDRVRAMSEINKMQAYYAKDEDADKLQPISITLNMDKFTLKSDQL